jgi:hypothetical protein
VVGPVQGRSANEQRGTLHGVAAGRPTAGYRPRCPSQSPSGNVRNRTDWGAFPAYSRSVELEDLERLDAEVAALEHEVARLRAERALSATDLYARLQDLHSKLNTCLQLLAKWQGA